MTQVRSRACQADRQCWQYDGHPGPHQYPDAAELDRLRRIEAAAGITLEWADAMQCKSCEVWAGSLFSTHKPGCPVGALRAALQPEGSAGTPDEPPRDRIDEANALGYREGYRAGRAAGITEVIDSQRATEGSARDGG